MNVRLNGFRRLTAISLLSSLMALAPAVGQEGQPAPAAPPQPARPAVQPAETPPPPRPQTPPRVRARGPMVMPVRFEATVFEVSVPTEKILEMNVDGLTGSAATGEKLLEALSKIGSAKAVLHVDQVIDLMGGDDVEVSISKPMAVGQPRGSGGDQPVLARHEVGGRFSVRGMFNAEEGDAAAYRLEATYSTAQAGGSGGGPVFRKIKQGYAGGLPQGQPALMLTVDTGGPGDGATAYVTRLHLRETGERKGAAVKTRD